MNRIPLIHQEGALKSYFPGSHIVRRRDYELTWIHIITPSPLSASYKLELHYAEGEGAKVYVLEPKPLDLAPGERMLPHVYSTSEQRLCLYYPDGTQWNTGMFYVRTLIPWACEWLCHYELWVGTGEWHGGGVGHQSEAEKQADENERISA
jgi:hypothetical protein